MLGGRSEQTPFLSSDRAEESNMRGFRIELREILREEERGKKDVKKCTRTMSFNLNSKVGS